MHITDWIAITSPGMAVVGAMLMATSKLTRLTVAVERLEVSMAKVAVVVEDHERRLNKAGY